VAVAANEARTVNQAVFVALQKICDYNHWTLGHAWQKADGTDELVSSGIWHVSSRRTAGRALWDFRRVTQQTRIPLSGGFIGRVARSGKPLWLDDVGEFLDWRRGNPGRCGLRSAIAFPVLVGGEAVAVLEFFSDAPIHRDDKLLEIMPDVGVQLGHIFQRTRLEKTIADVTTEQQRRIARELHDGVSQLLTGAAMLGESLKLALQDESSPHAALAERLQRCVSEAQRQARQLSRGLMPIELDAEGLMNALEQLAERCPAMYNVPCEFKCSAPVLLNNDDAATQLYYIACEALHNAVKHAGATSIVIRLEKLRRTLRLVVADDGQGISPSANSGMGQNIMRYRAGVIGATLDVVSRKNAGTRVICSLGVEP
jgi:signal transduction histidine kinase